KAYFLNSPTKNPVNAANLYLNLGNIFFELGQYTNAFEYYTHRLKAGVSFDNKNTQIMFYRRLGVCAFQVREKEDTVSAYLKTLELINNQMDPQAASVSFDRIHRLTMDRIVTPALRHASLKTRAQHVSKNQTELIKALSKLTDMDCSPPDTCWEDYRSGVYAILDRQEAVAAEAVGLLDDYNRSAQHKRGVTAKEMGRIYKSKMLKVKEDLEFPERLILLKAEMLDRLGLAYQEAGDHKAAAESFHEVFSLNQQMGMDHNLAVNLRSRAYNRYMHAQILTGDSRNEALKEAV
ncbi:MAG: tetratricopeptide repeat protein, partial [bacterium]|nr:tetratricopeptide repeat protein [bacterium]